MAVHMLDADTAEDAVTGAAEVLRPARERGCAAERMTLSAIDTIGAPAASGSASPRPVSTTTGRASSVIGVSRPDSAAALRAVRSASRGRVIGMRPGGAVGCPPGSRREGYRLGRWERLAMTIVVTVALVVVAITLLRPVAPATRVVTVLPGDTMTSLVLREVPDMDVTRAAELIEELNGLTGATVSPGMRLAVPAER